MGEHRHGAELVGRVDPVVLLYHPRAPDEARARQECEAMERLLVGHGPSAILVELGELLPPPPFTALRLYRQLVETVDELEAIAVVVSPGQGFATSIALAVVHQLFHLTRLSGRTQSFDALEPAARWLGLSLGREVNLEVVAARMSALRGDD